MKKILLLITGVLLTAGCEVDGELTREDIGTTPLSEESVLLYSGSFMPTSGIQVEGTAGIYQDGEEYRVAFENFSISGAPDLKVYLSKSDTPNEFINLGGLGSGENQTYLIPVAVDFTEYSYVLIHCQQFNHLYAIATLQQN